MLPLNQFTLTAGEFCKLLANESYLAGDGAAQSAIATMLELGDTLDHLATHEGPLPAGFADSVQDLGAKLMATAWHAQDSWLGDLAANSIRPMLTAVVRSAIVHLSQLPVEPSMTGQTISTQAKPAGWDEIAKQNSEALEEMIHGAASASKMGETHLDPFIEGNEHTPAPFGAAAATDPEHEATDAE